MNKNEIENMLNIARQHFLENDAFLLTAEVNERSITHKFAEYLRDIFGCNWHIDCEYNRYGTDSKKIIEEIEQIVGKETTTSETKTKTVFPDIIIHKRGSNGPNLLVIEAKKNATKTESNKDKKKLLKIKQQYGYTFAVFLNFKTIEKDIVVEFIEN